MDDVVTLTSYADVRDAFRSKHLRQALYDDGALVMADTLLNLHGDSHRVRRRLENRLFRRPTFEAFEANAIGPILDEALAPYLRAGQADLPTLGYRTTMNVTALVSGVDRTTRSPDETDHLLHLVRTFAEGATVAHSTRDRNVVRAEVEAALDVFDSEFLRPSIDRRRELLEAFAGGRIGEPELPQDVLTVLLRNEDNLNLPYDVIRREVVFYLQAGSHSTANAFTDATHDLFTVATHDPSVMQRAHDDRFFLQRCVHETFRLHPASPVAWRRATRPIQLRTGVEIADGAFVVMDLHAANRDLAVFGEDAATFAPGRPLPAGVPPWGLTFGGGVHACIGMELDGGVVQETPAAPGGHLYGTVALMVWALLDHGARPDPDNPPQMTTVSNRPHFGTYPVVFERVA